MTKKELSIILRVLVRIKDPDEIVAQSIAFINKDLATYAARKGQLRDQYESDNSGFYN